MTLDYTINGKIKIDIMNYILKILEDLPQGFDRTTVTPTASHLFDMNPDCPKLTTSAD